MRMLNQNEIALVTSDLAHFEEFIKRKSKSNKISPEDISYATKNIIQNNPGVLSSGVRKSQELFSKIFNKDKSQEK